MEMTAAAAPQDDSPQELTVEEYCMRRSVTDRRVELLGAFFRDEQRNKRFKDLESAYDVRLQAFANQPA